MLQFKVISGQSLLDVCLNTYGSFEFLTQLVLENNIQTLNDNVLSGQTFNWNPTPDIQHIIPIYSTNNALFFEEEFIDSIVDDFGNILVDNSNNYIT
jgi:hypothetical protein